MKLTIITPKQVVLEKDIEGVTVPSTEGEMTILPRHTNLFALLDEGIVRYWKGNEEEFLAIGGGYVETNGKTVELLVSRAYGQDKIDEEATKKAIDEAKKLKMAAKTDDAQKEVSSLLRRSLIDMKLLRKKKRRLS